MASALSAPKISLPIADHNAPLVGDELFGLQLNYQWRRVLVHLAENMLDRRIYAGTEAEIDTVIQQVHALLSDMYTVGGAMDYHGVFVARTTDFTLTTAHTPIVFDDVISIPHHDTDGYFNPAFPAFLQVPVGLGGYYWIHGLMQVEPGTIAPYLQFMTNATELLTRNFSAETSFDIIRIGVPHVLLDTQVVELEAWMTSLTRDAVAVAGGHNYSAQFGLYRIGDAP